MQRIKIKSPAKLNLSLEVLGKRPDGYHEIKSLMVPIDRFDEIEISLEGDDIECTCDNPKVPGGPGNLAYRAAEAFMKESKERFGVRIHIRKNIPIGAGLGGGSGNAASVLMALNKAKGKRLSTHRLCEIAASIGSDVPFFLKGKTQWASGRGEILEDGPKLPPWTYLVAYPGFEISAGWAYANLPLTMGKKNHRIRRIQMEGVQLVNHLEAAVLEACPVVGELKEHMLAVGARVALMTGSGPSVFGIFDNRREAYNALRQFSAHPQATVFLANEFATAFE